MRPSQKPGTAWPSTATPMPRKSSTEPRRTADPTPTGTATQKVSSSAEPARDRVAGSRSSTSDSASRR